MKRKAKIVLVIGLVVAIAYIVLTIMKKKASGAQPIDPYTIAQYQIDKLKLSERPFSKGNPLRDGSQNTIIDLGIRANTI
jgi:hypothetical protein